MKITFVLPYAGLAGGVRVVAVHAERLRRRGHEVTIVSTPPHPLPPLRRLRRLVRGRGGARPAGGEGSYFEGLDVDWRVIETRRPVTDADLPDADAVIATWWETAFWVAGLSPAKGRKHYLIQHHEAHAHLPARSRESYRLPLKKIVVCRWLADVMARDYGDPSAALVPNSVDFDQFDAPPRRRRTPPAVGMLYNPTPYKGVEAGLRAVEAARRSIPDLRLLAYGASPVRPELPLPPYAEFRRNPPQDRLREVYAACDVFLCPSWAEGFALPPLEAMACRCPVVSTRVGAMPELIAEGENGRLADPGDVETLARGLVDVLSRDEAGWRRMSDAAYATARRYSWDDAAALLEAALSA